MTQTPVEDCILGKGGSWLRLRIARYQFPDDTEDDWLMIAGTACIRGRKWSFCDPCLETYEVAWLADWLEGVAKEPFRRRSRYFTEPNLEFHRVTPTKIRIVFALECTPPWFDWRQRKWKAHGFTVKIGSSLCTAAASLRQQLSLYPQRSPVERP